MGDEGRFSLWLKNYISTERSTLSRYAISILFLIMAFVIIECIRRMEDAPIYSVVIAASVLASIHGGSYPSLMVSVFGVLLLDFFYIEPLNDILDSWNSFFRFMVFTMSALMVSIVVGTLRASLIETEEYKRSLDSAITTKNNLITVVAHDLRNPLGVIKGFVEITKDEMRPEVREEYLKTVNRNCDYCLSLIGDLQEFSTLEHSEFSLNIESFDVNKLLAEIVDSLMPLALKKKITLNLLADSETPLIHGDRRLYQRAFQNLIDNALKYSHLDSNVRVVVQKVRGSVEVAVVDAGDGIAPEEIRHIFTPFYKAKTRPTAGESSSGLGLATVAAILNAHGAKIDVRSEAQQGSTFTVRVPSA